MRRFASIVGVSFAVLALVLGLRVASAAPTWTNETAHSGIAFLHAGDDGDGPFLTVVNGGACWGDFDGDGYPDLYLTNGLYAKARLNDLYHPHDHIYRNDGDGTFTDVTNDSGATLAHWGTGCSVADYDGDGRPDLYVTGYSENTLLHNDGGFKFHNATLEANVSTLGKCGDHFPCWGTGSAWADVNGDGCLDLYVGNFVQWRWDEQRGNSPGQYSGQRNLFFRNHCDGTFSEESAKFNVSGVESRDSDKTHMVEFADVNRDGRPDILVTNDEVPLMLFLQRADGTFEDDTVAYGLNDSRANMGLTMQDVNGDSLPDVFVTHYVKEDAGYYLQRVDGSHAYRDRSGEGDLHNLTSAVGWSTGLIDVNADGYPDLWVVDGMTANVPDVLPYDEARFLFTGDGTGRFTNVSAESGPVFASEKSVGRGAAMADVDLDGALDLVIANTGNESAEFARGHGVSNRWLEIGLREPGMNREAIGAEISVRPDDLSFTQTRIVHAGEGYMSQGGAYEYFGLGGSTGASVSVHWPDGANESWHVGTPNATLRLTRGNVTPETDTLAPRTSLARDVDASGGWFRTAPTFTLSAVDRAVGTPSGVARIEVRVDGGAFTTYSAPFLVDRPGHHVLEYRAIDAAGNVEPTHSYSFAVDTMPPSTSLAILSPGNDGWLDAASRVSLSATDDASGVDRIEYRVDAAPWQNYSAPFLPAGSGNVTLDYRATDVAGNVEATRVATLAVDPTPPRTTLDLAGPHLAREDRVDITNATRLAADATDATSGIARVEYRIAGGPWTPFTASFGFDGDDGARLVEVRAVDLAGNVETAEPTPLFLDDHTPPALVLGSPAEGSVDAADASVDASALTPWLAAAGQGSLTIAAGPVEVRVAAGADVSGVSWTRVYVDGVERASAAGDALAWTWETERELPGWHLIEARAADGLGNVGLLDRWVLT